MTGLELLTTDEMAEADRLAVAAGVPSLTLMENAGRAVADEAAKMVAPGARIAVLCGPGNNGGDGFVAARVLAERGYDVRLACTVARETLKGDAAVMAGRWTGAIEPLAKALLDRVALVVDAIFGAGLKRGIDGAAAEVIDTANTCGVQILAVDVPSGVDGTTGAIVGSHVVRADRTLTFAARKIGQLLMPGRALCGPLSVADIGMPESCLREVTGRAGRVPLSRNAPELWHHALPSVGIASHKYTRGHAVVVSGPATTTGAARLAARGALRVGAGLVSVASPQASVPVNAAHLTAIMLRAFQVPHGLKKILGDKRHNAVLLGPGLGLGDDSIAMIRLALTSGAHVVLDADALTCFTGATSVLANSIAELQSVGRDVVLTPHAGEFARLAGPLPGSKLDQARALADATKAIVVYKGPDTIIAQPDGRAAINDNAPPTLATAGSGDVLAGFITGLLAQGMPAFEAACAAVWMHGECANDFGPGLIAEDLPEALPQVLKRLLAHSGRHTIRD